MEWRSKIRCVSNHPYRPLFVLLLCVFVYVSYQLHLRRSSHHTHNKEQYFAHLVDEKEYDDALSQKCLYRVFSDSVLVLNFNFPFYNNMDTLKTLYEGVFAKVLACGPPPSAFESPALRPDIEFQVEQGHFSYHCLALAVERYPDFKGYFYGQDDMIINWWTFTELDRSKIWHGTKVVDWRQDAYKGVLVPQWIWWKTYMGISACRKYYTTLKQLADNSSAGFDAGTALRTYLENGGGRPRCAKGWSDFFYIPGHLSQVYRNLSRISYSNKLYLEIAVHNMLRSMSSVDDLVLVDGVYMPDAGYEDYSTKAFWKLYNHQIAFIHPYKYHTDERFFSGAELKRHVIQLKQKLTDCFT